MIVTDTVPVDPLTKPANVEVLSISGLLAETIQNVFADDSVSAIFARREPALLRRTAQEVLGAIAGESVGAVIQRAHSRGRWPSAGPT